MTSLADARVLNTVNQGPGKEFDPGRFLNYNGTLYLLAKANDRSWQLTSMVLSADGLSVRGAAHGLVQLAAGVRSWEFSSRLGFTVLENPAIDVDTSTGGYELYYSGNEWMSGSYATGRASCRSPWRTTIGTVVARSASAAQTRALSSALTRVLLPLSNSPTTTTRHTGASTAARSRARRGSRSARSRRRTSSTVRSSSATTWVLSCVLSGA